jgi:hypothetical protein
MLHFTKDKVAEITDTQEYAKIRALEAKRIAGPFSCETREGTLVCQDGYLAIDSSGWPYPIAKDEFEKIYLAV